VHPNVILLLANVSSVQKHAALAVRFLENLNVKLSGISFYNDFKLCAGLDE
jgi:hypothetical protein